MVKKSKDEDCKIQKIKRNNIGKKYLWQRLQKKKMNIGPIIDTNQLTHFLLGGLWNHNSLFSHHLEEGTPSLGTHMLGYLYMQLDRTYFIIYLIFLSQLVDRFSCLCIDILSLVLDYNIINLLSLMGQNLSEEDSSCIGCWKLVETP